MAADFFEFREEVTVRMSTAPAAVAQRTELPAASALTVSQLTSQIDRAIRTTLPTTVTVRGEVSRPNYHQSGHLYFTLKDAGACIDGIMWRSDVARLKFRVENGLELLVGGAVKVFPSAGKYQLYVNRLQPVGAGALELALKQMREKLLAEGLFAADRKKPLPRFPKRIAIVTSRSTAALQDVLKVLRRQAFLQLFLYHVPVQGEGAGRQIAAALKQISEGHQSFGGIDLILLTRGGGSLEDLWQFNEECVARAIAASSLPIVTGIGHEIDTSIADLVADHFAHTPTEAANVIIAHWARAIQSIDTSLGRLRRASGATVTSLRQRFNHIAANDFFRRPTARIDAHRQHLLSRQRALESFAHGRLRLASMRTERLQTRLNAVHPRHQMALQTQKLQSLAGRLESAMRYVCKRTEMSIDSLSGRLHAMSPTGVMRRGYSITTRKRDGMILRSISELTGGERIVTRVADGDFESIAQDPKQGTLF